MKLFRSKQYINHQKPTTSVRRGAKLVAKDNNPPAATLVFDSKKLPTREEAIAQLDAWLVKQAIMQSDNCIARAASKLKVSKVWMFQLFKKYIGY